MPANSRWDLIRVLKGEGVCYRAQRCGQTQEWLPDRGTSTCSSRKSPPPVNTLAWLGLANVVVFVDVSIGSTIIRRLYKLTLSDQPQVILQLTVGLSDLVQRFFCRSAFAGGPKNFSTGARTRCRRPCPQPLQMNEIGHEHLSE